VGPHVLPLGNSTDKRPPTLSSTEPTCHLPPPQYDPLIPPALLRHDLPVPAAASKTISTSRRTTASIVQGYDPLSRLVVIVGPCSIHDVDQAKEYASRLRAGVKEGKWPGLEIVMRAYL
jgi:3-deoxy-7-phosphoheptulonate synthase